MLRGPPCLDFTPYHSATPAALNVPTLSDSPPQNLDASSRPVAVGGLTPHLREVAPQSCSVKLLHHFIGGKTEVQCRKGRWMGQASLHPSPGPETADPAF